MEDIRNNPQPDDGNHPGQDMENNTRHNGEGNGSSCEGNSGKKITISRAAFRPGTGKKPEGTDGLFNACHEKGQTGKSDLHPSGSQRRHCCHQKVQFCRRVEKNRQNSGKKQTERKMIPLHLPHIAFSPDVTSFFIYCDIT